MVGNGVALGSMRALSEKESKSISAGADSKVNVLGGGVVMECSESLFINGSCCNVKASPREVPKSLMLKNPYVEMGGECEHR